MIEWKPSTKEIYDNALNVLPPAAWVSNGFLLGEPTDHRNGRPTFEAHKRTKEGFFVSADSVTFPEFKAEFPAATFDYHS